MPSRVPARGSTLLAATLLAGVCDIARSEEGMWPPARLPFAHVERTFGATVSSETIERVQRATLRFGSATAFFVSPTGLVVTNHHVALRCVQNASTPQRNYFGGGMVARTIAEELRCPGQDAKVLISYADVTPHFTRPGDPSDDDGTERLQNELETKCNRETGLSCEVVSFFGGAQRMLYRYKKYEDIRLVAVPEAGVAYFGGAADNFEYPRHNLDVALLRVYEGGRPVAPPGHLRMAKRASAEGDFAIGAGHPFRTRRWLPVPQLELLRDDRLPFLLSAYERRIKLLEDYQRRTKPENRESRIALFYVRNSQKRDAGYRAALSEPDVIRAQAAMYERIAAALSTDIERESFSSHMAAARRIANAERQLMVEERLVAHDFGSRLFEWAVLLVRWAGETSRPEALRLGAFRGTRLRATEAWITSKTSTDSALEAVLIADRWTEAAQVLGAQHPFVREVADAKPEDTMAATTLADPAVRESLLRSGRAAILGSTDPLLVLARKLEPHLYPVRARYEREVEKPLERLEAQFGRLRLAADGKSYSPDANGSLRFSFGRIAGYREGDVEQPWKTTLRRMYERADAAGNQRPEALPWLWRERRAKVSLDGPYHFVATVDHSGGNSGSPMVNERGEWFGVQHDGNRQNFGTQFVYSSAQARAIALHANAILEWLQAILGANELAEELLGTR